jgi:N utilization substance protein B
MIDQYICERLAEGWRLERLDSVIRAILRCGVYEIMTFNHIDVPVIISEYMTIASGFVDARQSAFVNGLLDNVARSIRGGTREDVKSEPV